MDKYNDIIKVAYLLLRGLVIGIDDDYQWIYAKKSNCSIAFKIPKNYFMEKKIWLDKKVHLLNETSDYYLMIDKYSNNVWIPKEVIVEEYYIA